MIVQSLRFNFNKKYQFQFIDYFITNLDYKTR